ncbi:MAG: hypothetical protein LUF77_05910 [Oscillospiraceae bacterium]|nr:hypothetical protein [Oscillospiraceae bacterium]
MWKLYDDLYIGIPSGIRIDGCSVEGKCAVVRANGNTGLCRMLEPPEMDAVPAPGDYLRDTACHLRWNSLTRAAFGVAALNAWYNTEARVSALSADGLCSYAFLPPDAQVATVGYCPAFAASGRRECAAFTLPIGPDFDPAPYQALRDYAVVILSGSTLTARALPALLEIAGEDGTVVLDGSSVPCAPVLFSFDRPIRRLNGACRGADGTALPFSVVPQPVQRIHEQENVQNFLSSPYRASKFNQNAFAPWQGQRYDHADWEKLFKG